ncbi:hypothetical protein [Acidithiobacillus sp.]
MIARDEYDIFGTFYTSVETPETGYDIAESGLPLEAHKALARWAHKYKVSDDDPVYAAILAVKIAVDAAVSGGIAADLVHADLAGIPALMQKSILDASKDLEGDLRKILTVTGGEWIMNLQMLVNQSALAGADKLRAAASSLNSDLQGLIDKRKDDGINEWAAAAQKAGHHAAQSIMYRKLVTSSAMVIALVLFTLCVGAALGISACLGFGLVQKIDARMYVVKSVAAGYSIQADPDRAGYLLMTPHR